MTRPFAEMHNLPAEALYAVQARNRTRGSEAAPRGSSTASAIRQGPHLRVMLRGASIPDWVYCADTFVDVEPDNDEDRRAW